jgi:cold shock protein
MAIGIVKWFNKDKGYGFIKPDDGGPDDFVHISAVEKAGFTNLAEGARISYEPKQGRTEKCRLRICGSDKVSCRWLGVRGGRWPPNELPARDS